MAGENGNAPEPVDLAPLMEQMVQTAGLLTQRAGGSSGSSAAEAKDFAQGALFLSQAVVTLDPSRIQGGDTPQARKASTPTPPTRDTDRDGKAGES